jgi:hypothetical protein
MVNVAVLDNYQGVALEMADWSVLLPDCQVQVFRDHLSDLDVLADRLADHGSTTLHHDEHSEHRPGQRPCQVRSASTQGVHPAGDQ